MFHEWLKPRFHEFPWSPSLRSAETLVPGGTVPTQRTWHGLASLEVRMAMDGWSLYYPIYVGGVLTTCHDPLSSECQELGRHHLSWSINIDSHPLTFQLTSTIHPLSFINTKHIQELGCWIAWLAKPSGFLSEPHLGRDGWGGWPKNLWPNLNGKYRMINHGRPRKMFNGCSMVYHGDKPWFKAWNSNHDSNQWFLKGFSRSIMIYPWFIHGWSPRAVVPPWGNALNFSCQDGCSCPRSRGKS